MKSPHRLSIAGLMAFILVFSIGLAALRLHTAAWAGGMYFLTYSLILLALVGAACRPASERAWWLGFALFGLAYFRWRYSFGVFGHQATELPTTRLLELIRPNDVRPLHEFGEAGSPEYYWLAGQCIWSLLIGLMGGLLSSAAFSSGLRVPVPAPEPERIENPRLTSHRWRIPAGIGLVAVILLAVLLRISPVSKVALWAGTFYLLTWVILATAALGFACGRGRRRMTCLGAALFGIGYMTLNRSGDQFEQPTYVHIVADQFLEALRPRLPEIVSGYPAKTPALVLENARLRKILDRPIPMQFSRPTSLEDVLSYVRTATKDPDGREITFYVDRQALEDVSKTMDSTIEIDLADRPLSTTLTLALQQLNLRIFIRDGLLYITAEVSGDTPVEVDYYLLVGHSCLALFFAGLGAFLVPFVSDRDT